MNIKTNVSRGSGRVRTSSDAVFGISSRAVWSRERRKAFDVILMR